MNASYTFRLNDFTMMFNELYTDWFAKKETLDASQYFIKTDNFIYNNELAGETINVHIGAIIAFDLIPRSALSKSCSECNMYSQMAAQISSILLDTFSAITPDQMSVIVGPFIHTKNADKLNTLISKLSEYGDKYKISIEDAVRAVFVLNTDNAIAEQTLVHKIKNNQTNQWIKYADVLQHIPSDPITFGIDNKLFVIKQFRKSLREIDIHNQNIIVSLSGSVESCVCLYIIKQLLPLHNIVAVFFGVSDKKLKFVQKLCAVLNVKLYSRVITEVKCLQHHIVKLIQLDMYRKLAALFENNDRCVVLLGNTLDDAFENIIKNISVKNCYDNLSNYDIISIKDGLTFFRPLLKTRKSEVLVFGISMNIPFLKNTTPYWSNRAKIRDVVVPSLQNVNKNIIQSFISLKHYLQSADEIIEMFVTSQMLPKFTQSENKINALLDRHQHHGIIYNFNIWYKLFSSTMFTKILGTQKVSDKTIIEYIQFLKRLKKQTKFMLLKNVQVVGTIVDREYIMLEFIMI